MNIKTIVEYNTIKDKLEIVEDSYKKLEEELKMKQQQLNILQDSVEKGRTGDNR
ncbi:MAG: hypothetical protein PWQ77_448 [Kosmotogales bacterium]|nr:hypothetical protein [Kosmotogales bacterium]